MCSDPKFGLIFIMLMFFFRFEEHGADDSCGCGMNGSMYVYWASGTTDMQSSGNAAAEGSWSVQSPLHRLGRLVQSNSTTDHLNLLSPVICICTTALLLL